MPSNVGAALISSFGVGSTCMVRMSRSLYTFDKNTRKHIGAKIVSLVNRDDCEAESDRFRYTHSAIEGVAI